MSWSDIYAAIEAGAKFDLGSLSAQEIDELFKSNISDEDIDRVLSDLGMSGDSAQQKRETFTKIVVALSTVAGLVVKGVKLA